MICIDILKKNSANTEAVKAVKVRLNALMGSTLDVHNGFFGNSTEAVVKQFQKKNNLISDGIIGDLTWERLFTVPEPVKAGSNQLRIRAMEYMLTQLHVREKTGNNDGKEVEEYLRSVGLGKGYAWCMAFVFHGFQKSADDLKVKNLVPKTAGVMDCYRKAKERGFVIVLDPLPGDQFIMDFGKGTGHTGIVTKNHNKTNVFTVEGNTSRDPTYKGEDRDGNGVFERNRPISSILAFIRYI